MLSGLYSIDNIILDVKDETGITNLRNRKTEIARMIVRAEREINPYAGTWIKKKMILYVGNGNFDGLKIKLPTDFMMLDEVGCCEDGLCAGQYFMTATHLVLCDGVERDSITYTYWGLQCDGSGYPVSTQNHAEAVVAFIVWKMFSQKTFLGEGSHNVRRDYQAIFNDRAHEARGEDFFPSAESMRRFSQLTHMSKKELFDLDKCEDMCISCSCLPTFDENEDNMENNVWWWQFNSLTETITDYNQVDDDFLSTKNQTTFASILAGETFNYPYVGRIGFAIDGVGYDELKITDVLGNFVDGTFRKLYNPTKRRLIFISKEYMANSSIYFKFIQ